MNRSADSDRAERFEAQLAAYEVPAAPDDFASRVCAALPHAADAKRPALRRVRRGWLAALAGLGALAVVTPLLAWHIQASSALPVAPSLGERRALARETVALGDRGVAVLEEGALVSWRVGAAGEALVEQRAGSVFYRVERGRSFAVDTALGRVLVRGTCFRVEVETMARQTWQGAALGAAVATAVVVTVYEGRVTLAGSSGTVDLGPAETGRLSRETRDDTRPGGRGGPDIGDASAATTVSPPPLDDLTQARARIAELEAELRRARDPEAGAEPPGDPARYIAPSAATLRQMAEDCWVAFDHPPLDAGQAPVLVDAELSAAAGLSDAERRAINQRYQVVHDEAVEELRALYVELTGVDFDHAAALSIRGLMEELVAKSPPEDELAARRSLARERAGLDPPPVDATARSVVERYLRLRLALGHDAEAAAAAVVGTARARALRGKDGIGWQNTVSDYGGCQLR